MKPYFPILIVLMLVSASFIGVSYRLEKYSNISFDGITLYVGGSGEGNYTKIQDALDDASDGDTVFVYNGTYYEHIIINVSINLIGEDKEITIIDGEFKGHCVVINADGVVVKRFTIRNALQGPNGDYKGILVNSSNNKISENILHHHYYVGILVKFYSNNEIFSNYIYACRYNINVWGNGTKIYDNVINSGGTAIISGNNIEIYNNTIEYSSHFGIIVHGHKAKIMYNKITNCRQGIWIPGALAIFISKNTFENNSLGIGIYKAHWCVIYQNNFISNDIDGQHDSTFLSLWLNNYWGKPRTLPKVIFGSFDIDFPFYSGFYFSIPSVKIDWFPARKPFDIGV